MAKKQNAYKDVVVDGVAYIEFITGGKYSERVLVDQKAWHDYLKKHHWTVSVAGSIRPKTSIDKHTVFLHRFIVQHEYSELDYWGKSVDHKNNNTLDNRRENLRIYNIKLNTTNINSKYKKDGNQWIFKQPGSGYKVQHNIADETIYGHFSTLEEARAYRDKQVSLIRKEKIKEMIKKDRDIEFERGLRDKLANGEKKEVLVILERYGICSK